MTSPALPSRRRYFLCILAASLLLFLPAASQATDLSGCWSGTWESCVTPHRGPLNSEFVRLDANRYEVFFNGRFFKVMPFRYSVVMTASEQDGIVQLSGSKYLGRMVGTFSFNAAATDCQFNANYSSCKDSGTFTLCRCSHATSCAK
jgi:hypothetical protein